MKPPLRKVTNAERVRAFSELHGLSPLHLRFIFGLPSDVRVREIMGVSPKLGRDVSHTTMLLLRFLEQHGEFVPRLRPMDIRDFMTLFEDQGFKLAKWEVSIVLGRTGASGYRWLEAEAPGRNPTIERIADLFTRLRQAGWSDQQIVRVWLQTVYDHYVESVPKWERSVESVMRRIYIYLHPHVAQALRRASPSIPSKLRLVPFTLEDLERQRRAGKLSKEDVAALVAGKQRVSDTADAGAARPSKKRSSATPTRDPHDAAPRRAKSGRRRAATPVERA